ncbi:MAG: hypothetical protein WC222_05420 [Parachlamydiales bacterium]|jgi:hypothetical protein
MFEQINSFVNSDSLYWFCAVLGSALFLIQFTLNLIGTGEFSEFESDSGNFKWLTKQALSGFLMVFGWTALSLKHEFQIQGIFNLSIAFSAGFLTILASGLIFRLAHQLQSTGTVFDIDKTIGLEATVYQRIPVKGSGKITINIENITREIEAISHHEQEIPSFSRVVVLKKADDKTVVVMPL